MFVNEPAGYRRLYRHLAALAGMPVPPPDRSGKALVDSASHGRKSPIQVQFGPPFAGAAFSAPHYSGIWYTNDKLLSRHTSHASCPLMLIWIAFMFPSNMNAIQVLIVRRDYRATVKGAC